MQIDKNNHHLDYQNQTFKITEPFEFNDFVRPIAIPAQMQMTPVDSVATVSGWGSTIVGWSIYLQRLFLNAPTLLTGEWATFHRTTFCGRAHHFRPGLLGFVLRRVLRHRPIHDLRRLSGRRERCLSRGLRWPFGVQQRAHRDRFMGSGLCSSKFARSVHRGGLLFGLD